MSTEEGPIINIVKQGRCPVARGKSDSHWDAETATMSSTRTQEQQTRLY